MPTAVLSHATLEATRHRLESGGNGDGKLRVALDRLIVEAERWLRDAPDTGWSPTAKTDLPPSGDPHDYLTVAPYWWPSLDSEDGLPYVRLDGQINPESIKIDKINKAKVLQSSYILIAWFYTKDDRYSVRSAEILRTWFTNEQTAMTPHLRHAQSVPGVNDGRSVGIIDWSQKYTSTLDAAFILASAPSAWPPADQDRFIAWNQAFLDWLLDSEFGKHARGELNNHGTFASLIRMGIATALGKEDVVRTEVESVKQRIDQTIEPNGSQPYELHRTRTWHYTCFNLLAYARIAELSSRVGVDLWNYCGPKGQSLHSAVNYITPAATASTPWHHPETKFLRYLATDLIRASLRNGNPALSSATLDLLEQPPLDLWELCLVPENHDAVV